MRHGEYGEQAHGTPFFFVNSHCPAPHTAHHLLRTAVESDKTSTIEGGFPAHDHQLVLHKPLVQLLAVVAPQYPRLSLMEVDLKLGPSLLDSKLDAKG